MDSMIIIFVLTIILQNILNCHGMNLKEQLQLLLDKVICLDKGVISEPKPFFDVYGDTKTEAPYKWPRKEDEEEEDRGKFQSRTFETRNQASLEGYDGYFSRRFYDFHPGRGAKIIGVPTRPNHLPEAEPILPGHTLIRPALGMLKSAVKFPHKELDGGGGVYGNVDNLGITYIGTNERLLYTGFRRLNDNSRNSRPVYVIAILRKLKKKKPTTLRINYHQRELEAKKMRDENNNNRLYKYRGNLEKNKRYQNQEEDKPINYRTYTINGMVIQLIKSALLKEKAKKRDRQRYNDEYTQPHRRDIIISSHWN